VTNVYVLSSLRSRTVGPVQVAIALQLNIEIAGVVPAVPGS